MLFRKCCTTECIGYAVQEMLHSKIYREYLTGDALTKMLYSRCCKAKYRTETVCTGQCCCVVMSGLRLTILYSALYPMQSYKYADVGCGGGGATADLAFAKLFLCFDGDDFV